MKSGYYFDLEQDLLICNHFNWSLENVNNLTVRERNCVVIYIQKQNSRSEAESKRTNRLMKRGG